jgi:hypothetical protein
VKTRDIAGLGTLAVGLGIGAAIATVPGVASAGSSNDWLASVDSLLGGAALPAGPTPALDLAISIDGHPLVSDGSQAEAVDGNGDYASGVNGEAFAGGGNSDSATAINFGTGSDLPTPLRATTTPPPPSTLAAVVTSPMPAGRPVTLAATTSPTSWVLTVPLSPVATPAAPVTSTSPPSAATRSTQ